MMTEEKNKPTESCLVDQETDVRDEESKQFLSQDEQQYKWNKINVAAIPAKLAFFFENSKRVGYTQNLVLYLTNIGLNKSQAGIIAGFRLLGMMVGSPLWSMLADKKNCHAKVIVALFLFSILLTCSQGFLSIVPNDSDDKSTNTCPHILSKASNVNVTLLNGTNIYIKQKPSRKNYTNNSTIIQIVENQDTNQSSVTNRKTKNVSTKIVSLRPDERRDTFSRQSLFVVLIIINIMACLFEGPIATFIDTGVVRQIQLSKGTRHIEYGKQRLYSSIGGAFGIVVTNAIIDIFPEANVTCFVGIFVGYFLSSTFEFVAMMFLYRGLSFTDNHPKSDKDLLGKGENIQNNNEKSNAPMANDMKLLQENDQPENKKRGSMRRLLKKTLMESDICFFYFFILLSGCLYAQYTSFTLIYIKQLGGKSILLSLSIVISSLSGIVSFYCAESVIQKLGGPWKAIDFAFFVYFVRYLIFALIKEPWLILIAQSLHALSSALTVASGITHIKKIAPSQIMTTMCSLFNTLHYGVGNVVGSSVGGVIYEHFGGKKLFVCSSMLGLICSIVLLFYVKMNCKDKNYCSTTGEDTNELELKRRLEN